jgi:hypothetical protein
MESLTSVFKKMEAKGFLAEDTEKKIPKKAKLQAQSSEDGYNQLLYWISIGEVQYAKSLARQNSEWRLKVVGNYVEEMSFDDIEAMKEE